MSRHATQPLMLLCAAVLGTSALAGAPAMGAEWTEDRERERKGFTVWSRPVAESEYREYMVELHVDADADAVWGVLTTWDHEVMPRVALRQVVSVGPDGAVVYQQDDCDPFELRDYALRFDIVSASEPYELHATLAQEAVPPSPDGAVRVVQHRHRWTVRANGAGAVAVLIVHHDPIGVPVKLYHKGFLSSMKRLRKSLEQAAQSF